MWYNKMAADLEGNLPDFIMFYEKELKEARKEAAIHGNIETNIKELPAYTEIRFGQLQEIEAVLNFMNIQARKKRKAVYIQYEQYRTLLPPREKEKYIDGEDEIVDYDLLINEVALIRNKYFGIMKAFEAKNFMLGHVTRLRTAGMEDIEL